MEILKLKEIVEKHPNIIFKQNMIDETIIKKAEYELSISFPQQYKIWLNLYGAGSINGEEIFGIANELFNNWPNVVYVNKKMRQDNFISNYELAIQMNDFGEIYLFKENDDKVFIKFGSIIEVYSNSFFDFILKKVNNF